MRGSSPAAPCETPLRADRPEHPQLGELVLQRDRGGDGRLRVVGHHDHRVLGEELVDARRRRS